MSAVSSLDHLVGAGEERRWHLKAECSRRLQIDDELEFAGSQYWQLGGYFALEDTGAIDAALAKFLRDARPVAHQPAGLRKLARAVDRRQSVPCGQDGELHAVVVEQCTRTDDRGVHCLLGDVR